MGRRRLVVTTILIVAGVLVGIPLLATLVGSFLPRDHVAQVTIDLGTSREQVWSLITDFARAPEWRPEVTAVQVTSTEPVRYSETTRQGTTPFEVVAQEAPTRQAVRVVDDGLPFGGTWTWDLEPARTGTRLTITEAGFIRSPIFRVMSRLFFRPTATMEAYLRALARHFGEDAAPEVIRAR